MQIFNVKQKEIDQVMKKKEKIVPKRVIVLKKKLMRDLKQLIELKTTYNRIG